MAATQSGDVAFIVMLAGTGINGADLLALQTELILRESGVPEPMVALNRRIQAELLNALVSDPGAREAGERVKGTLEELWGGLPYQALTALGLSGQINQAIDEQIAQAFSPWLRFFLTFDPATALERVDVPVLALFGSKDLQVPTDPNMAGVRGALQRGNNPDFTVVELDGLNHLFQTAGSGLPTEYGSIEETMAPEALRQITDWIVARALRASLPATEDP